MALDMQIHNCSKVAFVATADTLKIKQGTIDTAEYIQSTICHSLNIVTDSNYILVQK